MSLDRISKLIESLDLENTIKNHINEKEKLLKEAARIMNRSNRYPIPTITEIYQYLSDPYSKTKSIADNIQLHYARMSSEFMQSLFTGKCIYIPIKEDNGTYKNYSMSFFSKDPVTGEHLIDVSKKLPAIIVNNKYIKVYVLNFTYNRVRTSLVPFTLLDPQSETNTNTNIPQDCIGSLHISYLFDVLPLQDEIEEEVLSFCIEPDEFSYYKREKILYYFAPYSSTL